jgi:hypothetical protein
MSQLDPIVNQPSLYVTNLECAQSGTLTLQLNTGAARDSTNTNDLILTTPQQISVAVSGVNGLDTGTIAASTFYACFIIGDSSNKKPTAGLISLSATTPTLPFGYDIFRRVGWTYMNSSAQPVKFWTMGTNESRTYYYNVSSQIAILTAGTATSFATVSAAPAVPISNPQGTTEALFNLTYVSASSANEVDFGIVVAAGPFKLLTVSNGAASTTIQPIWLPVRLNAGVPAIAYQTTSGSDAVTLTCAGFRDYL